MGYLDTELEVLRNVMKRYLTMDDKLAYQTNVQILINEFIGDTNLTYTLYELLNMLEFSDVPLYPDNISKKILGTNIFDIDLQDVYEICYLVILENFYDFIKKFENINNKVDNNLKELEIYVEDAFTIKGNLRDNNHRNKLYKNKLFQDFLDNRFAQLYEINVAIDNLKQSLHEEVGNDIR